MVNQNLIRGIPTPLDKYESQIGSSSGENKNMFQTTNQTTLSRSTYSYYSMLKTIEDVPKSRTLNWYRHGLGLDALPKHCLVGGAIDAISPKDISKIWKIQESIMTIMIQIMMFSFLQDGAPKCDEKTLVEIQPMNTMFVI